MTRTPLRIGTQVRWMRQSGELATGKVCGPETRWPRGVYVAVQEYRNGEPHGQPSRVRASQILIDQN